MCLRLCDILIAGIRFISTLTNHYKLSLFSFSTYYSTTMDLICSFLCSKFKAQQFSCIIHFHLLYLLNSICSFELINHHSLSSLHFPEQSYYSIYLCRQQLQSFHRFLCIHEPIYHVPVLNISKESLLECLSCNLSEVYVKAYIHLTQNQVKSLPTGCVTHTPLWKIWKLLTCSSQKNSK